MDEERRLPPFAENTLTLLTEAAGGTGEELPKEEAKATIAGNVRYNEADAEEALVQLESRGYIYYIDEHIPITRPITNQSRYIQQMSLHRSS